MWDRFIEWLKRLFRRERHTFLWGPPRAKGVPPCGPDSGCRRPRLRGRAWCHRHAAQVARIRRDRAKRKRVRAQKQAARRKKR